MKRALTLIFLALATPLAAHDTTAGNLHIDHPWMPVPMATAKSAAGYMVITNHGSEADALVEVRSDFAEQTMLHTTEHSDGVAKMTHVMTLPIAPGETATLQPDGLHVMFMGLQDKVAEGDLIPATLVFRHAGEVAVEFAVDAMAGHDHGDHSNHSGH
ncbi:copper chaperone PCu(A)C [Sagittula stellata]|uniref:Copper chaperone PCu(A)C n=1 Tax=Sagittula stellata (strain ATCC 700073 / DSM 11524 / E-37) TaxID=388399 RepID=A3K4W0_SAGS3|nr:copper chaperone PCu(A)C [Sagittula stellata]EBA08009.1 hypothetical protein SSE37_02110 [Sagittula stellata E-37]